MSCHHCVHLEKPSRWCKVVEKEVKNPSIGKCCEEEHSKDCDCDACEQASGAHDCDHCGAPLHAEEGKFCSTGCARAAESDRA